MMNGETNWDVLLLRNTRRGNNNLLTFQLLQADESVMEHVIAVKDWYVYEHRL